MREAEQRDLPYLFKLRQTANVKRLIKRAFSKSVWRDAGQGWEGAPTFCDWMAGVVSGVW